MSLFLGILSGVIVGGALVFALLFGALAESRDRRARNVAPLIRRDIDDALREAGCYVLHSESHFDLQLPLF